MRQIIGRCHLSFHEWCFCSCPLLSSKMLKGCSSESLWNRVLGYCTAAQLLFPRGTADPSFRFPRRLQSFIWWFCCLLQATILCFALPRWFWLLLVLSLWFCFTFLPSAREVCLLCSPAVVNRCSINRKKKATGIPTSLDFLCHLKLFFYLQIGLD